MGTAADSSPSSDQATVAYQSLYRRFRPQNFSTVRGQDHVTNTLRNAVATNRVAQAYLFSGPRGTGKTSTARILAKALNCTNPDGGEPCGKCESCLSITAGSSFDVHELDAASNNGVDAMRELVSRASLASPGRWKVYIVDEVHMLSTSASNALLKTLEEPPDHVVFVLATTDPQKVLQTIKSRTQHFEFHLLSEETLDSLLSDVATSAELELPDGAIAVARRRAKGSARDALSALDQVATAGVFEDDSDSLIRIIGAIELQETAVAIEALDTAMQNGRDPHQLAIDLCELLRAGFLQLVAPRAHSSKLFQEDRDAAAATERLGAPASVRAMEVLGACLVAMRDAPDPRITLEVALIRLTHPQADDSTAAIVERLDRLERRIEALGATPEKRTERVDKPVPPTPPTSSSPPPAPAPPSRLPKSPNPPPAVSEPGSTAAAPKSPTSGVRHSSRPALGAFQPGAADAETTPTAQTAATTGETTVGEERSGDREGTRSMPSRDEIVTAWGDRLLVELRPKVRAIYQAGRFLGVDGNHVVLALPNAAHIAHAEPLRHEVEEKFERHFGRPVSLRLTPDTAPVAAETDADDDAEEMPAREIVGAFESDHALSNGHEPKEDGVRILDDRKIGIAWAEDQLLQAFPGAQEIQGD